MALATASADGVPNCRAVLLKGFDTRGFVFYTNYESRKGHELSSNPRAALMFWWPELERQVRISGDVERVSQQEAEQYFASRPVGHQLGAWASRQSSVVTGREALEDSLAAAAQRFEPGPAPLPPWWGGFRVRPSSIEFWQGRPNRMHDRLEYVRQPDGTWILRRLAP
jgi:pyridoxamine 5'-phosphate oxidase